MATFDQQTCTTLAQELHEAEQRREQVRHFSLRYPNMSIEDGYAVSRAWAQIKTAEGQRVIGHKIGLTSRAMQVSSQIDEPDFGTLFDEMFYESGQPHPRGSASSALGWRSSWHSCSASRCGGRT